jgi:acetyl-CoA carboxylase biotin carboxyl carrier protein
VLWSASPPVRRGNGSSLYQRGDDLMEMDLEQIQKIIKLMEENDLVEFEMEKEGFRIALRKSQPTIVAPAVTVPTMPPQNMPTIQAPPGSPETLEDADLIVSPMVGTFYAASSPDSPPYVTVGQKVEPSDIVCIIEAMKVMNEIPAEISGTITEILVSNAEPVEYGQPLFRINKD